MPREPRWIDRVVVEAIHLDQIREHGGLRGLRDEGALEAALARPRNKWAYNPSSPLTALAAAYAFGLTRNHPFRDGNKPVAFIAMVVFLEINGWTFTAPDDDIVRTIVRLAAGKLSEQQLTSWVQQHSKRR
jgi:death on curing protein